jgi:hypothetical protein
MRAWFTLVFVLVAIFGNSINAQDAIDPSSIQIVGGSPDVRSWRVTASIRKVELTPADFRWQADIPGWRHVVPPGWDGGIQSTLFIVKRDGGQWRTTGSIEFWSSRTGTGSPLSSALHDWWYYAPEIGQPQPGETIGVFIAAGDLRRKDVESVQERSNIVTLVVPAGDTGVFDFAAVSTNPAPPVVTPPTQDPKPPLPAAESPQLAAKIDALAQQLALHEAQSATRQQEVLARIDEPGWFMKLVKSPTAMAIISGLGTCFATDCWHLRSHTP